MVERCLNSTNFTTPGFLKKHTLKIFRSILCLLLLSLSVPSASMATGLSESESVGNSSRAERYIKSVYEKIKFTKHNRLRYEPFRHGMYGYLNLLEAGKINASANLTICDFTLSSNVKRLWVIDIRSKKLLFHSLVAHGMGTGEEFAVHFSNTHDSHQSSLGFYVTGDTYTGNNGYSLKLHGLDGSFNNNAFDRAIVIHGADYVSENFAKANQRLGRSHGCPALPAELAPKVIDRIKDGHCLFIYHTKDNYLSQSYWLKSGIKNLPAEADQLELQVPKEVVQDKLKKQLQAIEDSEKPDAELAPLDKQNAAKKESMSKEAFLKSHVSQGDRETYKVEMQTIVIQKPNTVAEPPKKISSVIYISEKAGVSKSDTLMVK